MGGYEDAGERHGFVAINCVACGWSGGPASHENGLYIRLERVGDFIA